MVAAAAVMAWLLLAGCAAPPAERGSASGGAASTLGPPSSTAPGSPSTSAPAPSTAPPAPPTSAGKGSGQVVVRGTVRNGVEPGCVLLDGQDKQAYLLLDARRGQLQAGARVEVVGQPVDHLASFCGEGSALSVVSVRPLR
jgi:hypothetical protein